MAKIINEEFKRRWIEALRSGKYVQGHFALHPPTVGDQVVDNAYCCLGVACVVATEMGLVKGEWAGDGRYPAFIVNGDGNSQIPPIAVMEAVFEADALRSAGKSLWYVNLPDEEGNLLSGFLPEINDRGLATFEQIADMIERDM